MAGMCACMAILTYLDARPCDSDKRANVNLQHFYKCIRGTTAHPTRRLRTTLSHLHYNPVCRVWLTLSRHGHQMDRAAVVDSALGSARRSRPDEPVCRKRGM